MLQKQCLTCYETFFKGSTCSLRRWMNQRKYCSLKCKGVASRGIPHLNKAKIQKWCKVCDKQFEIFPYRIESAQFCSRSCLGKSKCGERSVHWQGGITAINFSIRNSDEYKKWRIAVFERDNYTCKDCGIRGGQLEADHIKLFSKYPDLRLELSNGQTLCKRCHRIKTAIDLSVNWVNQFGSQIKAFN